MKKAAPVLGLLFLCFVRDYAARCGICSSSALLVCAFSLPVFTDAQGVCRFRLPERSLGALCLVFSMPAEGNVIPS